MKILIIEDEKGIVSFLKEGLTDEHYKVTAFEDGELGLEAALKNEHDLILLDWMLPTISGIKICETIRKTNKTIPIIFLTAKDSIDDTILGLQTGANDYIKKPFHFDELLERIKVQLRNATKNNLLTLGNIVIDITNYKVTLNGKNIVLTQKELALLTFLIKNKGKICTRTEIIEQVWDIHFEYQTGVIDVYINALRKKLNLNHQNELIKTIRGVGYIADEI